MNLSGIVTKCVESCLVVVTIFVRGCVITVVVVLVLAAFLELVPAGNQHILFLVLRMYRCVEIHAESLFPVESIAVLDRVIGTLVAIA